MLHLLHPRSCKARSWVQGRPGDAGGVNANTVPQPRGQAGAAPPSRVMPYSSPFGPKAIPVGRSTFRSPVSVQAPPADAGRKVNTVAKVVPNNAPPAPTTPAEGLSSFTWKAYSVVRDGGVWARAAENMKTASDAAGRSANAVLRNLAGSLILLFVGDRKS